MQGTYYISLDTKTGFGAYTINGPAPLADKCDGWSKSLEAYNGGQPGYTDDVCNRYMNLYHN